MDVVLLRKLSRRSVMGFGKKHDAMVQNLLDLKNYKYLRWCYYNCSMITFMDDILDEIGVREDERISKPGNNPEMFLSIQEKIDNSVCGLEKVKLVNKTKSREKGERVSKRVKENFKFSKKNLQSKNHGK